MNKSILLSVGVFLAAAAYAQPFGSAAAGYRIIQQRYTNSSGEKGNTFFFYDRDGRLCRSRWILDDGSKSSDNLYGLDRAGNIVSAFRQFADGITSNELFLYDSAGNKTAEYFYRSDSVAGYAVYSVDGRLIRQASFRKHKGWLWGDLFYRYGSDGRVTNAELKKGDDVAAAIHFHYDSAGNLAKEIWDFAGRWTQEFDYRYEKVYGARLYYASPFLGRQRGFRISREDYSYNGKTGGPSYYHYDHRGLLVKKEFTRSDGFSTVTSYGYDDRRRLIASGRTMMTGERVSFIYRYDKADNLIQRIQTSRDSIVAFESYLYDDMMRPTKAYFRNVDGWLTGEIRFSYDQRGRIEKGFFKGEDKVDAVIVFSADTAGNVAEIVWTFSSGAFQRYAYEYEPIME